MVADAGREETVAALADGGGAAAANAAAAANRALAANGAAAANAAAPSSPNPVIPRAQLPTDRTLVMGILNLTPDSFSDGGKWNQRERALRRADQLREDGADIIDIGAESTRPGSQRISVAEEQRRLGTIVQDLVAGGHIVSVDTINAATALACAHAGAHIINDVSGGCWDPEMPRAMASTDAAVVIQHYRGMPGSEEEQLLAPRSLPTMVAQLRHQVERVIAAGVEPHRIVIDPGLGFAKDAEVSWEVLANLEQWQRQLPWPVLIGASRKRMIRAVASGDPDAAELDAIATGVTALCAERGVWAVRVHEAFSHAKAITAVRAWRRAKMG